MYGKDFYRMIGSKGGRSGHTGGFASMDIKKVKEAGRKGGLKSRRSGINNGEGARRNKEYIWKGEIGDELTFAKD